MSAPVRAVSLDVDGTLYRVRRFSVAWRLRHERGLLLALVAAREKIRHEGAFSSEGALHQREAELVAPSFELDPDEARRRIADLRSAMPAALTRGVRPFPGLRGALEAAATRGIRLAILSDYDAAEKLDYLGLADLPWAARVNAEAVGALKPQPEPFSRLCDALGLPPGQIVHVGDREDVDVAGALGAGLRAWRFAPKKRASTQAERVFDVWRLDLFRPLWEADDAPGEGSSSR